MFTNSSIFIQSFQNAFDDCYCSHIKKLLLVNLCPIAYIALNYETETHFFDVWSQKLCITGKLVNDLLTGCSLLTLKLMFPVSR
jgi:hypothetical protein